MCWSRPDKGVKSRRAHPPATTGSALYVCTMVFHQGKTIINRRRPIRICNNIILAYKPNGTPELSVDLRTSCISGLSRGGFHKTSHMRLARSVLDQRTKTLVLGDTSRTKNHAWPSTSALSLELYP